MRVLFVDHEPIILRTIQRWFYLEDESWEIHVATNADQATGLLSQQTIDAVVAETNMRCADGTSLYVRLKELQPHCECLILAGYVSREQRVLFRLCEIPFVNKPCPLPRIKSKLIEMVAEKNSPGEFRSSDPFIGGRSIIRTPFGAKKSGRANLNPWHSGQLSQRKVNLLEESSK